MSPGIRKRHMSRGVNISLILELVSALSVFGVILFSPKRFYSFKEKHMVNPPTPPPPYPPKQYNLKVNFSHQMHMKYSHNLYNGNITGGSLFSYFTNETFFSSCVVLLYLWFEIRIFIMWNYSFQEKCKATL